ncbi:molybdenum ABC transporter ATP-binding protein [Methyloligella sp. 2.7D]|uniref:molybdenum ABC transporter ATP-binding protein n=1 Tax=unclassified Methyloligella TaxID=2625955 RepID=UPI00157D5AEF|nr:molybdenum ABC transporter ATP-binding protein [Methyloligella sp. GL2]QKP78054.1 molybdenum ABC transporter ATP-binding protein [Methyloligella sp. GL2]
MSIAFQAKGMIGDLTLDIAFQSEGRLTALFGPSGAGKSTIVNIIAGLLRPKQAKVTVDGTVLTDTAAGIGVPTHKRRIGYVFQEARLFPHLSVKGNLLYGRFFSGGDGRSLEEVTALLGLDHLLDRGVGRLSGGERQRVAIGRALLAAPRLLLLDEPLSSLDEARKQEVMPYLERIRDEAGLPIVYVSHSIAEVARLATSVVLVERGHVLAAGPASEILSRIDLAVAEEAETGALVEGRIAAHEAETGLTVLETPAGDLRVPRLNRPQGASVRARIRARDVMIATKKPQGLSALNILPGTVTEIGQPHGPVIEIALQCGEARLVARLTRHSVDALGLKPGRKIYAVVKSIAFDPEATTGAPDGKTAAKTAAAS